MKYSDLLAVWLSEIGYTHYFYVGGGNIMHLTESLSKHLIGVPVVHEVASGIAAEYFNEISNDGKALSLVTAGPGITNMITAIAGAWLESRELLIIGGQVKTSDLSHGQIRGRGIQEVDGTSIVSNICKTSVRLDEPIGFSSFANIVHESWIPRKGPVFLEIPIDVQAKEIAHEETKVICQRPLRCASAADLLKVIQLLNNAKRPVILLGGGISFRVAIECHPDLIKKNVPVMTTYNGADRFDGYENNYFGRPNTWGQRSSNILIQKADLIVAIGTRLGLQQTGFNWQEFGREAQVIQIDIDQNELSKGHPHVDYGLDVDADDFLVRLLSQDWGDHEQWLEVCCKLKKSIPRIEKVNHTGDEYISPYEFIIQLEDLTDANDLIVPCSSGSAFTLCMQLFKQKLGQRIITNKSLASMGYGLSGAIGAAIASKNMRRTLLIEGDGGFAQNMQELGTASLNKLNIKIFVFDDKGHASIRMTQKNYFNGKYLGCDRDSGLGLPNWEKLFSAWDIPVKRINRGYCNDVEFLKAFNSSGIFGFVVSIDPEQTYYPKINSKVGEDGNMTSNALDKMSPEFNFDDDDFAKLWC